MITNLCDHLTNLLDDVESTEDGNEPQLAHVQRGVCVPAAMVTVQVAHVRIGGVTPTGVMVLGERQYIIF